MNVGVILGLIILAVLIGIMAYNFGKQDKETKIANIKQWLKLAVVEAEKALGSGTGQLKLRYVYDLAVKQFPWIVTLVTFEIFSGWVDEALDWMREQLKQNSAIEGYTMNRE
jgi:hypothetical protein